MVLIWAKPYDVLLDSFEKASTDFLTERTYTWTEEFYRRNLYKGSYMPLTYYAKKVKIWFSFAKGTSSYANRKLKIKAKYELTNLGKRKRELLLKTVGFERTTIGSIAMWLLRWYERKRQREAIEDRSKNRDWQVLKEQYKLVRDKVIAEVYLPLLDAAIQYLTGILNLNDWDRFRKNVHNYITEQQKGKTSMVATSFDERYPYKKFLEINNPEKIIRPFIKLLELIKFNFFSNKRLNPDFILAALRNRPLDLLNEIFGETESEGEMDRSREANGQPPFSLFWMMVYEIKKKLIKRALRAIERIYDIKFYDPIRYSDFYYRFTHFQNGLYVFGDNGLLIEGGEIQAMYDLSISDVFQAYLRRDGKRNFCFFLRLDAFYDCGSTGDAFTSIWNIEGQIFIWYVFRKGLLSTDKNWPEIKDLCEETITFLGHCWIAILKDWITLGVRLTKDSAKKMISFEYQFGKQNVIELEGPATIPRNEFLATAISSGVLEDCRLKKFYEWVFFRVLFDNFRRAGLILFKDKEIKEKEVFSEEKGVIEQIESAKEWPGFLKLTEMNLDELALPYLLV